MFKPVIIKKHVASESNSQWITKSLIIIILFLVVVNILFVIVWYNSFGNGSSNNPPLLTKTNAASVVITPSPQTIKTTDVRNAIQKIIVMHPELQLGVSYIDLKNNSRADVGGTQIFTAGSTAKVFVACLFLSQVEVGKFNLDKQLGATQSSTLLKQMINRSDNDAWVSLMNFVGFQYQLPYAKKIGITTYNFTDNTISPNDMALLLSKLYSGQLLNVTDTALLLSYMQNTNMEDLIPAAVPTSIKVFHKYGSIDGNLHDAAIIDDGKNPFVLVIFSNLTKNLVTYSQRLSVFHDIVVAVENVKGIDTSNLSIDSNSSAAPLHSP